MLDMNLFEFYEEEGQIIRKKVGDWTGATHIHAWFDRMIGDIQPYRNYEIEKGDLLLLYDKCKEVVKITENTFDVPSLNRRTLKEIKKNKVEFYQKLKNLKEYFQVLFPENIGKGKYFSSKGYGIRFLENILNTIEILEPLLEEKSKRKFIYYPIW